jgi:hypothetical protein
MPTSIETLRTEGGSNVVKVELTQARLKELILEAVRAAGYSAMPVQTTRVQRS